MDRDDCPDDPSDIVRPPFQPVAIPEDLYSDYESGPFSSCSACSRELSGSGLYEIQKVLHGRECVFEMAICHDCGEDLSKDFSEESLAAMKGFLLCNFRPAPVTTHCHFCGFPRSAFRNYTLLGICRQASLLFPSIVLCEKCGERLQDGLSRKTRDSQDGFVRDVFPGVPEDLDLHPTPFPPSL